MASRKQAKPELFAKLQEFKWRDVTFPTTKFKVSLKQDLVQHKYPDKDGANIEATGRAPLQFSASIPFRNGIAPGPNETWSKLYPQQYRAFLSACSDRSTGTLQHPELGFIKCKVESCETQWDANRRDGVDVDVVWLETIEVGAELTNLAQASPLAQVQQSARDLDAKFEITVKLPDLGHHEPDLFETMTKIAAVGDQASLLSSKVSGKINRVAYRMNQMSESLDRAKSSLNWPIRKDVERMKASLNNLSKSLLTTGRSISFYELPKDMTLAAVAATVGRPITDMITLNKGIMSKPVIPKNTLVRYYTS